MSRRGRSSRRIAVLAFGMTFGHVAGAWAQAEAPRILSLVIPGKSLPSTPRDTTWLKPMSGGGSMTIRRGLTPVGRSFAPTGIKTVILRASEADQAEVITAPPGAPIQIHGLPEGNEVGYHPADPSQERVAPPYRFGLDFAAKPFGSILVISTVRESRYIHHDYRLIRLRVLVPPGVEVVKQTQPLSGDPTAATTHLEAP